MRDRLRPTHTLVGGHRGNPADHPENTLVSFASALEVGVDLIECDVHLSLDGELVVIHDHLLDATTNGKGPVGLQTFAELRHCGRERQECQVLWTSPWDDIAIINRVVHPKHHPRSDGFELDVLRATEYFMLAWLPCQ